LKIYCALVLFKIEDLKKEVVVLRIQTKAQQIFDFKRAVCAEGKMAAHSKGVKGFLLRSIGLSSPLIPLYNS